jgi:WD40 repeat protein
LQRAVACLQRLQGLRPDRTAYLPQAPSEEALPACPAGEARLPNLGRFQVQRELGRGAFGIVYLAFDSQLGRAVALKVPRPEILATPELRARFEREARAAAGLDHPNLVPVYEAGADGTVCYIASAYCPGVTLAAWLSQRRELVPYREAAQLLATLAAAVQHAHSRGVVHRDLKPANILLEPLAATATAGPGEGLGFVPRVTDFGLAKLMEGAPRVGGADAPTQSGVIMGTPAYMAPEQAGGRSKGVGPAADVYALGAILYELLSGRPPFQGETVLDTLLQVQGEEPVRPSRLRPRLPRDLETICLKCLHKVPGKRYASAAALAEDLRRFLAGESIQARPVGRLERSWRWCRRNPAVAGLLAAVGLTLVAGTAVAWWLALEAENGASTARKEKRVAVAEQKRADQEKDTALREKARAQENLVTSQLLRVGMLCENDPEAARLLLHDEQAIPVGLRDAAWGFYDGYCRRSSQTLRHAGVERLAWSADGKLLASLGVDGTTRVWAVPSGQQRGGFQTEQRVYTVALSADGKTLATAAADGMIKLWETASGRQRGSLKGGSIFAVAWTEDNKLLASASLDGTIKLWDPASGQERDTLKGLAIGLPYMVDLSTQDLRTPVVVRGAEGATIKLWDAATDQERDSFKGQEGPILWVAHGGRTRASMTRAGTIRLWDTAGARERRASLKGRPAGLPAAVGWSEDGKRVALVGWDGTIKLWDAASGQERASLLGGSHLIVARAAWGVGSKLVAREEKSGRISLWDPASGRHRATVGGHNGKVLWLAWSVDGKTLASAGKDGTIRLRYTARDQERTSLKMHSAGLAVAWSNDGKALAAVGEDGRIQQWEAASGQERASRRLPAPLGVGGAAFSADGKTLAWVAIADRRTLAQESTIRLWDMERGREHASLKGLKGPISSLAWSADGKTLASTAHGEAITLWDVTTGQKRVFLQGHTGVVVAIAFSPDGKTLASASVDKSIRLWDLASGRERGVLKGHRHVVHALAWSVDSKTLAAGGGERPPPFRTAHLIAPQPQPYQQDESRPGELKLWNTATGQERATLKGHSGAVNALTWSPDGRTLASVGMDWTLKLWDVAIER